MYLEEPGNCSHSIKMELAKKIFLFAILRFASPSTRHHCGLSWSHLQPGRGASWHEGEEQRQYTHLQPQRETGCSNVSCTFFPLPLP